MQYIGDNVRYVAKTFDKLEQLLALLPILADESTTDEAVLEERKSLECSLKPRKIKSALNQIPDALADSIKGVEGVSKIVAAMKEFSHPGSEDMGLVDINRVLESTITVARNEWKYVADVSRNFASELPQVPAFASELNQAFLNIIVNASHAIGDRVEAQEIEKGAIDVTTDSDEQFVVVKIQDTGGGIPAEISSRIFEPFFTTKDVGKGTGQGLAIAHSVITQKHKGSIDFEVEHGVGTTFLIKIPRESCGDENDNESPVNQNATLEAVS
jgi:signal transduction histidine kinase